MFKTEFRKTLGLSLILTAGVLGLGTATVAHADDQATRVVVGDSSNFVLAANAGALLDPTVCNISTTVPSINCDGAKGAWSTVLSSPFDATNASNTTLIAETSTVTALLTGDLVNASGALYLTGAGVRARVLVDCALTNTVPCDPTKEVGSTGGPQAVNLMQPGEIFLDQVLRAGIYSTSADGIIAQAQLVAGARSFNFYMVGIAGQRKVHNVVFQVKLNAPNLVAGNTGITGSAAVVAKRTMILSSIKAESRTR